ncbi:hypothetical protein ACVV62_09170 [Streptococcus pluranimalium]
MLTYEDLKQRMDDKKSNLSKKKEIAETKLKETYAKVTKTQRELEKAEENLDAEKYTELEIKRNSLKKTTEMLTRKIKEYDNKLNNTHLLFDETELKELHEYTEKENLSMLEDLENHYKAIMELSEKSLILVKKYDEIARLFYRDLIERGVPMISNKDEYNGWSLVGFRTGEIKDRIEVGNRIKSKQSSLK